MQQYPCNPATHTLTAAVRDDRVSRPISTTSMKQRNRLRRAADRFFLVDAFFERKELGYG